MAELGDFLRRCRAGLTPEAAGLHGPGGAAGRRVRGLRREEVAQLAGVSADYYTRLEQGRHTSPSEAVLDALARALLTDWTRLPPKHRNYTRWVFLDPAAREAFPDWPTVAAEVVGTLRLYAGRHPDDVRFTELVGELAIKSPEFRAWWNDHQVHERTHGTKRMAHPAVGPITIRYEALALPGDEEQTLFLYTTDPGSSSSDNLRLLALLASQQP